MATCLRCLLTTKEPQRRIKEAFLKPRKPSTRAARPHCTFDIESKGGCFLYDVKGRPRPADATKQERGFSRPFLLDFYDGQEHMTFRSEPNRLLRWDEIPSAPGGLIHKFLTWLFHGGVDPQEATRKDVARYQGRPIYAHNGGRFDFGFLYRTLSELETPGYTYNFSTISVPARTLAVRVWREKRQARDCKACGTCDTCEGQHRCLRCEKAARAPGMWLFHDSAALIALSLDKAAKTFGVATKLQQDLDMDENDPRWEAYVRRDCEVLHEVVSAFQDKIASFGGVAKSTQAATAVNIFQTQFLKHNLFRDVLSHSFVRESYVGGRTEALIRHGQDLASWDINSSYPASMMERQPVGWADIADGLTEDQIADRNTRMIGFVDCIVSIPKSCWLPPLPYRTDRLTFPTGTFRGKFHSEELALLRHPMVGGNIVQSFKSLWYQTDYIFVDYVKTLYAIKSIPKSDSRYDEGLAFLVKLLLNSLYGKFGQSPHRHKLIWVRHGDPYPLLGEPVRGSIDRSDFWEVPIYVDAAYIIPQIAANVTSKSRIRLWLGCIRVLAQGLNVYYVDTDSIACDRAAMFDNSAELGGWKLENLISVGEYVSPKFYRMQLPDGSRIHKAKGIWGEMLKGDDGHETFEALLRGETITRKTFTQQKTMMRNGHPVPFEYNAKKSTTGINSKRILTGRPNGHTRPIHIEAT